MQRILNIVPRQQTLGAMATEDACDSVFRCLTSMHRWLLLVDNANSRDMLERLAEPSFGFLPPSVANGHVLLLTQQSAVPQSLACRVAHHLHLGKLDVQASAVMLHRCASKHLGLSAQRYGDADVLLRLDELRREARAEHEAVVQLAGPDALDGFPLALEHAGLYIGNTSCGGDGGGGGGGGRYSAYLTQYR